MNEIKNIYGKYKNLIEQIVYPVILLLYPLVKINQGVDVSDSTYSLGNYLFFDRMQGMWVVSTYLSNVLGSFLVHLPGGDYLVLMNLYTGLIVSMLSIFLYFLLKKTMKAPILFAGEILAISFCWIPTGILYNYMTYLFFSLGAVCIYLGFEKTKQSLFFVAGIFLGASVMVRFPNLTQAALIISVWFGCYLYQEKKWLKKTVLCLLGYLTGIFFPFLAISIQYGKNAYINMIASLMNIQNTDDTYSPFSMVTSVFDAYIRSFRYVLVVIAVLLLGIALFHIGKERFLTVKKIIFFALLVLMLRFLWGRGMFSFRYYEDYSSMFEWGMLLLYLTLTVCIVAVLSKKTKKHERLMASIVLIIVLITPLGSNNYTCQNLNNLFLAAPYTLYMLNNLWQNLRNSDGLKRVKKYAFVLQSMMGILIFMIFIQSIGFHFNFVFRDGMHGEKRDTKMSGITSIEGIYTNSENADALSGLISYCIENKLKGQEALFFGDAPGLSYVLNMPFAITTSWPDLDSYSIEEFKGELSKLEPDTIIIMGNTKPATKLAEEKKELLNTFMKEYAYQIFYQNEKYTVYQITAEEK